MLATNILRMLATDYFENHVVVFDTFECHFSFFLVAVDFYLFW